MQASVETGRSAYVGKGKEAIAVGEVNRIEEAGVNQGGIARRPIMGTATRIGAVRSVVGLTGIDSTKPRFAGFRFRAFCIMPHGGTGTGPGAGS